VRRPETPGAKKLAKEQGRLEALMGMQVGVITTHVAAVVKEHAWGRR
jgi:hypothetical protein